MPGSGTVGVRWKKINKQNPSVFKRKIRKKTLICLLYNYFVDLLLEYTVIRNSDHEKAYEVKHRSLWGSPEEHSVISLVSVFSGCFFQAYALIFMNAVILDKMF